VRFWCFSDLLEEMIRF